MTNRFERAVGTLVSAAFLFFSAPLGITADPAESKSAQKKGGGPDTIKRHATSFRWVNPPSKTQAAIDGLRHGTFRSEANGCDIGFCIYLPPGYGEEGNKDRRYPVVYWLHGGRPGSELKGLNVIPFVAEAIRKKVIPPTIYVFNNGGEVSHYDFPERGSFGETALIKELIPHIDAHFRTVAERGGRGIEGGSQGGRATGRIMFKYPELFSSAVPLFGGHQHEKDISENEGVESPTMTFSDFKTNTYDLAREYAARKDPPPLKIFVAVGTEDFNLEANRDWMGHLTDLGVPFESRIVDGVPHSADKMYRAIGDEIMRFHAKNFAGGGHDHLGRQGEHKMPILPMGMSRAWPAGSVGILGESRYPIPCSNGGVVVPVASFTVSPSEAI